MYIRNRKVALYPSQLRADRPKEPGETMRGRFHYIEVDLKEYWIKEQLHLALTWFAHWT
jgi:hypothetical protein